jgi:uncharacterized protein YggE
MIMGITVSGVGEANAAPDMVEVDVGVSVLANTVEDATRTAAERASAVSSALTAGGIAADDMTTTAGRLLDSIATAGGDETRVNGLSFGIADETSLLGQAREAAWNDAIAKADQLATLSGHTLGKATTITEVVQGPVMPMPRIMAADRAMSERASTPIQPGTSSVTVTLQVEFGFRE